MPVAAAMMSYLITPKVKEKKRGKKDNPFKGLPMAKKIKKSSSVSLQTEPAGAFSQFSLAVIVFFAPLAKPCETPAQFHSSQATIMTV